MPNLPVDGATGWGDTLNAYLNSLTAEANSTQSTLNNHAANNPADPHGDRAYTQSLVNPIISGVNGPNGFVKTNSSGAIPANLIATTSTGGMYSNIYDAVAMFGAVPGTSSDQSSAIQNALNYASSKGGGIVYLGPGTFSLANYLVIPNSTWLLMAPNTVLSRIAGSTNARYLISNVQFGTSNTPSTNFRITGGTLDAYGSGITSVCTPLFMIQATNCTIEDVTFNIPFAAGPAIEVNGCTYNRISGCLFKGIGSSSGSATAPSIRVNSSSTSTTPSGLASGLYTNQITSKLTVSHCGQNFTSSAQAPYGAFIGSDLVYAPAGNHSIITVTGCYTVNTLTNGSFYPNGQWSSYVTAGNSWSAGESSTVVDIWHNMTLINGWTVGAGGFAQYKLMPDNTVMIRLNNVTPGTITDATSIWTAPTGYVPAAQNKLPLIVTYTTAPVYGSLPFLYTNGSALEIFDLRGTVSGIDITIVYPLD